MQEKTTDASGTVDFGLLNPGYYYYGCSYIHTDYYYGEGDANVTLGKYLEQELLIKKQ